MAQIESAARVLQGRTLDTVVPQSVEWIWPGWLAKRYINLIAGETGAGKSTVLADMVARITTGAPWPDEKEKREPSRVLWLGAEDGMEDMTVPRLMAAGANLQNITEIQGVLVNGRRSTFSMQDDLELVRDGLIYAIKEDNPFSVIVIDPITSYLPGSKLRKVDMNDSGQMRSILEPWMALAREFDIAPAAVTHFAKDTTRSMIHRVLGSTAFTATCRSFIAVTAPPSDSEDAGMFSKVMIQAKTNLPDHPGGAWRFETERIVVGTDKRNGRDIAATRAVWNELDESITMQSLMGGQRGPVSKTAIPFGIWLQAVFSLPPKEEWKMCDELLAKAVAEKIISRSWWDKNSSTYLEKANRNGTWFCRLKNHEG